MDRFTLYMSGTTETITRTIEDFAINGDTGSATTLTCTFLIYLRLNKMVTQTFTVGTDNVSFRLDKQDKTNTDR